MTTSTVGKGTLYSCDITSFVLNVVVFLVSVPKQAYPDYLEISGALIIPTPGAEAAMSCLPHAFFFLDLRHLSTLVPESGDH